MKNRTDERNRKILMKITEKFMRRSEYEMLVEAETILKDKRSRESGYGGLDENQLRAELRELEKDKISDYESYKTGNMTRERFIEKKAALDSKKTELSSALAECEARKIVADEPTAVCGSVSNQRICLSGSV